MSDPANPDTIATPPIAAGVRRAPLLLASLSFISFLILGCTASSLAVYLPALAPFALAHHGTAGSLGTAFLLAMSIANLPVGWALDRVNARGVLVGGILCTAAGCLCIAAAQTMAQMIAAMALTGVGVGAATLVPGIALIMRRYRGHQGLALAIFLGIGILAAAAIPPVIDAAISHYGWRNAFLLSGCAIGILCLPCALILRPADLIPPPSGPASPEPTPLLHLLRDHRYLRFAVATTMIQLAINGVMFAAIACLLAQGFSQSQAVWAYSISNFLGLPSLFFGGLLADRFGPRRVLVWTLIVLAIGTAAMLVDARYGLLGLSLFIILWGTASGLPGQAGSMLLATIIAEKSYARALGLNTAVISLIGALAPLCTDWLVLAGGGYALPVAFYTALALLSAPLIASLVQRRSEA